METPRHPAVVRSGKQLRASFRADHVGSPQRVAAGRSAQSLYIFPLMALSIEMLLSPTMEPVARCKAARALT